MQIYYVQFNNDVSIGGDFNAITNWSREKHGKRIQLEEKGSYFVLTLGNTDADGVFTPSGDRRRVPLTSVAYVSEREEPAKPKKKEA